MEHRLDVVAIRIEHEGAVVAGVVMSLARSTVVPATGGQRGAVEGIDGRAILGLEGQVDMGGDGPGVGSIDEEFIDLEPAFARLLDLDAEDPENSGVKVAGNDEVLRP